MWKSAYVGVYQLLNWKMHGETLKFEIKVLCLFEKYSGAVFDCNTLFVFDKF